MRYSHTTIEYAEPRIWEHERDYRDFQDGREDVQPLEDPITQAIAEEFGRQENLLKTIVHLQEESRIKEIDITVNV